MLRPQGGRKRVVALRLDHVVLQGFSDCPWPNVRVVAGKSGCAMLVAMCSVTVPPHDLPSGSPPIHCL